MTSSHTPAPRCQWFSTLAHALDPRSGRRLAALLLGLILARGRKALSSWIRAAGLSNQYRRCYATAAAVGRRTERVATRLLLGLIKPLVADSPRVVLALDVELVRWAHWWLEWWGKAVWVVADGASANASVLQPLRALGVTVVSRLRKGAALCSVPPARDPKRRGRPRVYGAERVSLATRAGAKGGWTTGAFALYGKSVEKAYKTFVATWRPAGGMIRVVLVDEPKGWVAFSCTDPEATVADILGLVSDRFGLETCFRDLKQVVGAGQQQVRGVASNVGCFHLCAWSLTMTEVWAWNKKVEELVAHRSASPWDDPNRRPSHADRRRAWQRELLAEEIQAVVGEHNDPTKIRDLAQRCLDLAA